MSISKIKEINKAFDEAWLRGKPIWEGGKHISKEGIKSFWNKQILSLIEELEGKKEVCICAAIKLKDGRIYRGHRHGDCFRAMMDEKVNKKDYIGEEQGFMTTKNRFVGRQEGRKLQEMVGIKSADKEGYRGDTLFSEDLY